MSSLRPLAGASTLLTVALVGVGVAHADAPWSPPAPIAERIDIFWTSALTFSGDGHALATLTVPGSSTQPARILAASRGTSRFKLVARIPHSAAPAPFGRRGIAYLQTLPPSPVTKLARLGARLGTVQGELGRFQQLARVDVSYSGAIAARIAADPRGNVAVAWLEPRGQRLMVRVALRRPGHAFGSPTTVGEASYGVGEGADPLSLSYGASGDLVLTFQRTTTRTVSHKTLRLAVRVKRPGARFGATQTLGPTLGNTSIETSVAANGSAVVAWGTQDGGEGIEDPWAVRAAVLRQGARRFSTSQLLDPGTVTRPVAGVSSAISGEGTATVTWSGGTVVRVATSGATGRFSAATQLSLHGAALGVVTAADGATTVLWGALTDPEAELLDQILASHRPTGASRFAAPEPVSPRLRFRGGASMALDPRTGRPSVLWIGKVVPADERDSPLYSVRGPTS